VAREIKVFQVTDTDWVAALNPEEARKYIIEQCGYDSDEAKEDVYEKPIELTPEEMGTMLHHGEDGVVEAKTFQQELETDIADGIAFPVLFATTEY
jgi:hypothetical protein